MQNLFRDKLDRFRDRLILFLSVGKELNEQELFAWLDTIVDIRKQMWDVLEIDIESQRSWT